MGVDLCTVNSPRRIALNPTWRDSLQLWTLPQPALASLYPVMGLPPSAGCWMSISLSWLRGVMRAIGPLESLSLWWWIAMTWRRTTEGTLRDLHIGRWVELVFSICIVWGYWIRLYASVLSWHRRFSLSVPGWLFCVCLCWALAPFGWFFVWLLCGLACVGRYAYLTGGCALLPYAFCGLLLVCHLRFSCTAFTEEESFLCTEL